MIVITGAAGFVGMNLAKRLVDEGRQILLIDDADRFVRLAGFERKPNAEIVMLDLAETFPECFVQEGATIVHLAALAHVDYSMHYPDEVLSNNLNSTTNVLRVTRKRRCRLLFGSSVEVYGTTTGGALVESSRINPLSPYAASKVACEAIVRNHLESFELDGVIVRFTNLYGPWQLPDRIVPRLIGQSLFGLPGEVDSRKQRDYLFVEDAVEALISLIDGDRWKNATFNISSGIPVDNFEIADQITAYSNGRSSIRKTGDRSKDGRGGALVVSPVLLMSRTGWRPKVDLHDGICQTFDWYSRHVSWLEQFREILGRDRQGVGFLADALARKRSLA